MSKTDHNIEVEEVSDAERQRLVEETRSNVENGDDGGGA
ncbi:MAG: hypothetical protein ACI8XM_000242 [Haloarculaceae archaeon]|jgi:hypothetical protein